MSGTASASTKRRPARNFHQIQNRLIRSMAATVTGCLLPRFDSSVAPESPSRRSSDDDRRVSLNGPVPVQLTDAEERYIAEAEQRIAVRLAEIEKADRDGRLAEAIHDVRSIREQLRPFLDESPFVD